MRKMERKWGGTVGKSQIMQGFILLDKALNSFCKFRGTSLENLEQENEMSWSVFFKEISCCRVEIRQKWDKSDGESCHWKPP